MSDELERTFMGDGERQARLRFLEEKTAALESELRRLARMLCGNGEGGIQSQLEICRERLDVIQSQWKWIVGVLTTVAVAVAQACLRR